MASVQAVRKRENEPALAEVQRERGPALAKIQRERDPRANLGDVIYTPAGGRLRVVWSLKEANLTPITSGKGGRGEKLQLPEQKKTARFMAAPPQKPTSKHGGFRTENAPTLTQRIRQVGRSAK